VVVFVNGQGLNPGTYAQTLFDIVTPAITSADENTDAAKATDPSLEKYVGMYSQPLARERHVLILDGQLVIISLPSSNPMRGLMKLKAESPSLFRRVREDGELGERVEFELHADGRVARMIHNNNFSYRVPAKGGSR